MRTEKITADYMKFAEGETAGEFNFNSWLLNYIDTHM